MCLDQSTLKIIFVVRRKGRQKPPRVFLLRAAENLAVITSYRSTDLFQASFEIELHEGSYPFFARPHHFEVLVLVNGRHFQNSDKKKRYVLRLPDLEPPTISSNPGSLGFPGCALLALVRPVPPTLAPSLQRSRSVPWLVVLDVQSCTPLVLSRAGDVFPVLGSWVQTNQYCNPIRGSPLWVLALGTRSLLSCGRWFLTHWRCPQSALGRWCLWLLRLIGA